MELSDVQDYDDWYRKEHLEQLSKTPSWRRSGRYQLVFKKETVGAPDSEKAPNWLTLHEFEEGSLPEGEKVVVLLPQTDWTKKVMGSTRH
jgi:hypothetical protein